MSELIFASVSVFSSFLTILLPACLSSLIFCGCRRLPDYEPVLTLTLKPVLVLAVPPVVVAVSSMMLLLTTVILPVRVHLVFLRAGSYPISNLRFSQRLLYFGVLDACCSQQVLHLHCLSGLGSEERGIECNIANIPARDREAGKSSHIETRRGQRRGEDPLPYLARLTHVREGELHHETDAP